MLGEKGSIGAEAAPILLRKEESRPEICGGGENESWDPQGSTEPLWARRRTRQRTSTDNQVRAQ